MSASLSPRPVLLIAEPTAISTILVRRLVEGARRVRPWALLVPWPEDLPALRLLAGAAVTVVDLTDAHYLL